MKRINIKIIFFFSFSFFKYIPTPNRFIYGSCIFAFNAFRVHEIKIKTICSVFAVWMTFNEREEEREEKKLKCIRGCHNGLTFSAIKMTQQTHKYRNKLLLLCFFLSVNCIKCQRFLTTPPGFYNFGADIRHFQCVIHLNSYEFSRFPQIDVVYRTK